MFNYFYFLMLWIYISENNGSVAHIERSLIIWIGISTNEVLENQFGILEVRCFMIIRLPMNSIESLLKVLKPPDKSFDI